jgi:hypothetical protein
MQDRMLNIISVGAIGEVYKPRKCPIDPVGLLKYLFARFLRILKNKIFFLRTTTILDGL